MLFDKKSDYLTQIFLSTDGDVVTKSDWGVKKLAYPINKEFRGRYLFYDFIFLKIFPIYVI